MANEHVYAQVALDVPLYSVFDYRIPPSMVSCDGLKPGVRVKVPFGRQERVGVVTALVSETSLGSHQIKSLTHIVDESPVLDQEILALCTWASQYYHHPLGEVIAAALPTKLRQAKPAKRSLAYQWRLTQTGRTLPLASLVRAPRQRQVMEAMQKAAQGLPEDALNAMGLPRSILNVVEQKGWVVKEAVDSQHNIEAIRCSSYPLSTEQQKALTLCQASLETFNAILIEGVTGSGKTEVYLQLIEACLAMNRQALVLVPEIGLTPQTVQRFKARFACPVAVLHSGLNDTERLDAWCDAKAGKAGIVIGTRSAIFTPFNRLGVIIVDEEHDASFKQQEGFRYSARDLAVVRAKSLDIAVILGSATPSFETLRNVREGRYQRSVMKTRAGGAKQPTFRLINTREVRLLGGLAQDTLTTMAKHLSKGQQVLVFLNRRGFAPVLMCHACGWVAECQRCESHFTLHQVPTSLQCHHCQVTRALPKVCPQCQSRQLIPVGLGTERVESTLSEQFKDYAIVRIDRDSTRGKGQLEQMLQDIQQGRSQLLLGTQMLAKGHHFPNVTCVVIVDVDYGLFSADVRALERMGQLIIQVAGRAGRAEHPGEVLLQSHHVQHPILDTLIHRGYAAFAEVCLQERQSAGWPPYTHAAVVRAKSVHKAEPMSFLQSIKEASAAYATESLEILGPIKPVAVKRAGKYAAHLLIQSASRLHLHRYLDHLVQQILQSPQKRNVHWSLDVDPLDML